MRHLVEEILVGYRDLRAGSSSRRGESWLGRHRLVARVCLLQTRIVLACQAVPRMPTTCSRPHPLCSVQHVVDLLCFRSCVAACERAGMDSRGPSCSMFEAT